MPAHLDAHAEPQTPAKIPFRNLAATTTLRRCVPKFIWHGRVREIWSICSWAHRVGMLNSRFGLTVKSEFPSVNSPVGLRVWRRELMNQASSSPDQYRRTLLSLSGCEPGSQPFRKSGVEGGLLPVFSNRVLSSHFAFSPLIVEPPVDR